MNKIDGKILARGLKRMVLALITAFLFGLSVYAFILTATATGYWAVVLFLSAIALLGGSFIFMYAQGITGTESQGDSK